jgi:hypothetical protein
MFGNDWQVVILCRREGKDTAPRRGAREKESFTAVRTQKAAGKSNRPQKNCSPKSERRARDCADALQQ